jgi:hypothetical protein
MRSSWDTLRINSALARVLRTAPMASPPADRAQAELFVQLCRRDLYPAILACKSLLRYSGDLLSLTFLMDGSIRPEDRALMDFHLPGCRWLGREDLLQQNPAILEGRPHLSKMAHSPFVLTLKLLLPSVFARKAKVIMLDCDTVFFRRPELLLEWIRSGTESMYLYDFRRDDRAESPAELERRFSELFSQVAPGKEWRLTHRYFNSGLLAFDTAHLDFDIADRTIGWVEALPPEARSGAMRVWFNPWVMEQTAYLVMYAVTDPPAVAFDRQYCLEVPNENGVFCHFMREGLTQPANLEFLREVVQTLPFVVTEESGSKQNRRK